MKLNLGCGFDLAEGYTNIDCSAQADLCLNLELAVLPYPDESVEEIRAYHVLEHIRNLIPLMNECYRVLKPGGFMDIRVPRVPYEEAFQDPTHVRFFTGESFSYFHRYNGYWQDVGKTYGILPFDTLEQSTRSFELRVRLGRT